MLAARHVSAAVVSILLTSGPASAVEGSGGAALTTINADSAYPEGPSVVNGILYYAEMGNDRVMRFDGAVNSVVWTREGCGPTTVLPIGEGSLAVLCHREEAVVRISPGGEEIEVVDRDRDGRRFSNPNAGTADGKGGIYFSSSGSFSPGARPTGAILHLDASGVLTRVAEGIHYANGVALSPDRRRLYASEHLERRVLAYDVAADGTLSNRRIFVSLDDLGVADPERTWEVGPDGLNVDRHGNVIVAEYGAGHLLVISGDAALVATIPVPERYVTASAFDATETHLFITAPASLMDPSRGAVYVTQYPLGDADE